MAPHAPRADGDADAVLDEVCIDLPPDLTAPRAARVEVRRVLARWHLASLAESVTLAVSELVGNALVHGRPPVHLVLSRGSRHLRAGVHDHAPGRPVAGLAPSEAESGRGLAIIHAVADDSGVEEVPGDGKIVYATFTTDRTAAGGEAPVVPLRIVRPAPDRAVD